VAVEVASLAAALVRQRSGCGYAATALATRRRRQRGDRGGTG